MHSFIYEIAQDAVHPDDWADESNFYDDVNVDYTTLLTGQERTNAIEELYDYHWFRSLFYRGKEPDTIVLISNGVSEAEVFLRELLLDAPTKLLHQKQ